MQKQTKDPKAAKDYIEKGCADIETVMREADRLPADLYLNAARLYALLADVLRTMADPNDPSRRFPEGEKASADLARRLADQAAGTEKHDPLAAVVREGVGPLPFLRVAEAVVGA